MWSMKRSRANGHVEISEHTEIRRKPMPSSNQQVANFSYPRTDFVHLYRRDDPVVRDSLGSESSPPPMVEDHGSDLSAEDDCQYRVAGSELWDSWPAREHKGKKIDYPAFIKSPTDRNFSLSKITTRSSPSLANLAKAHHQASKTGHHHKPVTPADLYDRPLPPLPTERPETPPQVSVFETDTDDEADEDDGRPTSEAKKFARRLMHGLVHHHLHHHHDNEKRDKGTAPDHKRSISDDGPSGSKEGGGGGRMGISRTFNAAARYRHSGGTADAAGPPRAAVSMDLPRDSGHRQYQQMADEGEKGGRFWSGRASNELLGRIWKRRC
ncbi:4bce1a12-cdf6-4fb5-8da5-4ebb299613a4 [Thermothielavioides terrestris]|uniref:4bce1a12-cdf6-4fb5-8da5-4ebb299613a4 n=1 Tax=Thermothielavioides terrestris TaxID=2587410 RepID=A0A446BAD6_9PEZI|nr:4bce1a12-cdf6-4fb5-8da5-4ebb299613a4 [Thermothielavioides terrestris]